MDRQGNAIAISSTLNGFFGSAVIIPKYGILLNNGMYNFSINPSKNNSLKPGKRPQTSLTPTIILKNHQPYLILGGAGAERIVSMLAQIIINVVDFNLPLAAAIQAPRFHYNYADDTVEMETRIQANDIEYLKQVGHKINLKTDYDDYFGSAQAILLDSITQQTAAVNDVRQKGMVYVR
jgi:gamma-glutamyltranspeptidase/glutathione hydrolase